ncbi:putative signal peptide [Vibrio angustum S14]|uniref:Putative signal peptide n=1 Tax=Photobacterium angustum (strain S14 / CCUG 15956) TaxID=314292 RepID=Q1ZN48_PHOAS|nr:2'-5' RNA ligase family protein [Photobacterium angustum]EAS63490.1 putative signal peptide [Vibrio angustum S14] [Photobacterium angustum S14]
MFKRIVLMLMLFGIGTTQVMAENMTYNVFLIPAKAADQTVETISSQLKHEKLNSLYSQHYLPHITLYLTEYPEGSLAAVKAKVKQLTAQIKPFYITLDKIERTKGDWLMLNVENSRELQHLADSVTVAMEPLRAPNPQLPNWVAKYPAKLAVFKRYGSPNVFTNFQPHITLLPKADSTKLDSFMLQYGNSFKPTTLKVEGIGIAKVDANGQAKLDLASYYFKK